MPDEESQQPEQHPLDWFLDRFYERSIKRMWATYQPVLDLMKPRLNEPHVRAYYEELVNSLQEYEADARARLESAKQSMRRGK